VNGCRKSSIAFVVDFIPFWILTIDFEFSCSSNARLAGIVYMQNMANDALYRAGSGFKPDDVDRCLKKTCGSDWHQRIVFVCSHWDEEENPKMKEKKLKYGYWRFMVQRGSPMGRFGPPGNFAHAKLILSSIVPLDG
jgi:hypothetical protein